MNEQTNINVNMKTTSQFINKTYDNLSYFDLYGNSVIIFIFMTLFVFFVYSYCKIMQEKEAIADDWTNQRCKPQNIPFAGLINKPDGTTAFQYTNDNFQYCVQHILTNVAGYALEPFQYMINSLTQVFTLMAGSIQQSREITNKLRNGVKTFAEDILGRILNVMIPIQKMFIALMDTFQKIQGVMTGGLYTMLGSYYTLQSLMGAIMEFIIKVLSTLAIIIVGLWVMPFTWPAAASMTAVFLAISIPLSIIIYFMSEVLHVKTAAIPKLRCFDKNTKFTLINGEKRSIEHLKPQDKLIDSSTITATIKITSEGLDMYNLNGIIISESHVLKYGNKWIHIRDHPDAIKLKTYAEPYLYCLNTDTKIIYLNGYTFTDWDEIYEGSLEFILNYLSIHQVEMLHKILDVGFTEETKVKTTKGNKTIDKIRIGDILTNGGVVYGIVELTNYKNDILLGLGNGKILNLLVSNEKFETENGFYGDYNNNVDSILKLQKNII